MDRTTSSVAIGAQVMIALVATMLVPKDRGDDTAAIAIPGLMSRDRASTAPIIVVLGRRFNGRCLKRLPTPPTSFAFHMPHATGNSHA
jgi:hypothetical protein